jgi:hypothetical protein
LKRSLNEATLPSLSRRVGRALGTQMNSTSAITQTSRDNYDIVAKAFPPLLEKLRVLIEEDLKKLENDLEEIGAPWTPGRVPRWKIE